MAYTEVKKQGKIIRESQYSTSNRKKEKKIWEIKYYPISQHLEWGKEK